LPAAGSENRPDLGLAERQFAHGRVRVAGMGYPAHR